MSDFEIMTDPKTALDAIFALSNKAVFAVVEINSLDKNQAASAELTTYISAEKAVNAFYKFCNRFPNRTDDIKMARAAAESARAAARLAADYFNRCPL